MSYNAKASEIKGLRSYIRDCAAERKSLLRHGHGRRGRVEELVAAIAASRKALKALGVRS